jgi:hypothetical protein
MASATPSENFFNCRCAGLFAKFLEIGDSPVYLLLSVLRFPNNSGNATAVPGDDDHLAALHVVEELCKIQRGFGRFNFSRHTMIHWSI